MTSVKFSAVLALSFIFSIPSASATAIPEGMGPLPATVPEPVDNPTSSAKVELGKKLYFEPALSKSGHFSCNSCHNLATWGVDNQKFSIGHQWKRGGRNAPTVLNAAFWSRQFWDGRAPLLEDQAKGPPLNPVEMALGSKADAVSRLSEAGYQPLFAKVFGKHGLTFDDAAKAIAAFERTLITPNARLTVLPEAKAAFPLPPSAACRRSPISAVPRVMQDRYSPVMILFASTMARITA